MAFRSPPLRITPRKRHSGAAAPPPSTSLGDNDDAAERHLRQRRRQALAQQPTPIPLAESRRRSAQLLHGLSAVEIADHYSNCIKLSSENKITSKNAFGLHLIDYMQKMVRDSNSSVIDITNFQVVSCTLDASTKIYAGRVDSVHSDAIKILSGIGTGKKEGGGNEDEDGDRELTQKEKKKRKIKPSRTVETNSKNLNVANFELEYDADPTFRKWVGDLDEGGSDGLLLNALELRDETLGLMLDPCARAWEDERARPPATKINISELKNYYSSVDWTALEICKSLSSFRFNNWDESDEDDLSDVNIDFDRTQMAPPVPSEFTFVAPADEEGDNDEIDGDEMGGGEGYDDVEPGFLPSESDVPDEEEARVTSSSSQSRAGSASGPLHLTDVIQRSEYSYFDANVLSTWAGPNHWKFKQTKIEKENKTGKKPRVKKTALRLDFTAKRNFENEFARTRAATVIGKATLAKMNSDLTTLPMNVNYEKDQLMKLFLKPELAVRHKTSPPIQDNNEGEWYNYDNMNDSVNYCPALQTDDDEEGDYGAIPGDGDGFIGADPSEREEDQCHSPQVIAGEAAATSVPPAADGMSILVPGFDLGADQTFLLPANMVAQPHRVERIHIDYVNRAKRVDVKRVKEKMWGLIRSQLDENPSPTESSPPKKVAISFKDLYKDLLGTLAPSAKADLSFHISVVCLLHLANEKGLYLSGVDSLDDISVALSS